MKSKKNNYISKILVIGDLMLDHYLIGNCNRISPEAPVQIAEIISEYKVLGGAGNVVSNLRSLESRVGVISVIGKDSNGEELKAILKKMDVSTEMIFEDLNRKTTKKSRILSGSQQIMRFDHETKEDINDIIKSKIFNKYVEIISDYDCIIISDYGKGVLRKDLTSEIISYANKLNKKVLVDPKGEDFSKYSGSYLMTPNLKEASHATKINISDDQALVKALLNLKENYNLKYSLITLSERGIALFKQQKLKIFKTKSKEVYDVTGAGDTVISALAYSLSKGNNIENSIKFANYAAGVVVGKVGSATATISEIDIFKSEFEKKNKFSSKIIKESLIGNLIKKLNNDNKKIVFTNGCFDILHPGHFNYLSKAKSLGDVLILGLNSDTSVKKLKGKDRPINNETDRATMLSYLNFIDYIVIFNDLTPKKLIKKIKPDILTKGGDYSANEVVGSEFSRETVIIPFLEGFSSSSIIQKINM